MSACHLVPPITVVTSANGSWFIERTCWWGIVINCLMINSRQEHGKNWKFQQHHEKCKGWQTCNCYCIAMIWLFDSRIPYLLFSKSYRYFCSLYSLNILIHWVIWLLDTSPYGACDVYRLLGKLFICTCISACISHLSLKKFSRQYLVKCFMYNCWRPWSEIRSEINSGFPRCWLSR